MTSIAGLLRCSFLAIILNVVGCCLDCLAIPDRHRVRTAEDEYHRIIRTRTRYCIQHLALRVRSEVVVRFRFLVVRFFLFFSGNAVKTRFVLDSAPLLPNIVPHLQTLVNFVTNTLPKPVLFALLYRLTVLHLASRILPKIGADSWEAEDGVDDGWDGRPVSLVSSFSSSTHFSYFADLRTDSYVIDLPSIHICPRLFTPIA
jgi:hypothetical protein